MAHAEQLHQSYIQIQCETLNRITIISANLSLLKTWNERYKQRRILAALPSELLKDVGISSTEALLESQKWFWQE